MKGFHLGNTTVTLLLTAPPYIIGAFVSFCVAYSSDRNKERGWHIAVPMATTVVGFIVPLEKVLMVVHENVLEGFCASPQDLALIGLEENTLHFGHYCGRKSSG